MTDDVDKARNLLKNADSPAQSAMVLVLIAIVDRLDQITGPLDRIAAVLEHADEEGQS